jgi:enediyne biosynthesis protein E4
VRPALRAASKASLLLLLLAAGAAALPPGVDPVVFEESAEARGIRFVTHSSRSERRYQPETMVAGVALLDYDNDGWLDVYVVNGAPIETLEKSEPRYWNRLYHNRGDGTFEDVTEKAGVAGRGYDLGVVAADYDGDGDTDLFVAGLRRNTLFRNNGDGTFTDVTEAAGLARRDEKYGTLWSIAGAFFDYDHDGRLDLFVSNYVVWDRASDPRCGDPASPDYCRPEHYEGLPNSLFHNNGDGTFTDVSAASGIRAHVGKGMGIGVADFDGDGWSDVFVANDTVPSFLFMNDRDGTFTESAFERGIALPDRGEPVAGMGVDARDVDGDGRPDVFLTALTGDTFPLFHNAGGAVFEDASARTGVGALTRPWTGWGDAIVDLNNDGHKDLFAACAGVLDPRGAAGARVPMPNALFLSDGKGRFVDGGPTAGPTFARKAVHRGSAVGDIDNDGRLDVVVTAVDGALELWHNVSPAKNHWLSVAVQGVKGNRDGMGAQLTLVTAAGTQHDVVNTAVGYGSASDSRVHFGLGAETSVRELKVVWPTGQTATLHNVAADQLLKVPAPK